MNDRIELFYELHVTAVQDFQILLGKNDMAKPIPGCFGMGPEKGEMFH